MNLIIHRVTQRDFRNARGAAEIRAVCGVSARSITLDNEKVTCKRCLVFLSMKPATSPGAGEGIKVKPKTPTQAPMKWEENVFDRYHCKNCGQPPHVHGGPWCPVPLKRTATKKRRGKQ